MRRVTRKGEKAAGQLLDQLAVGVENALEETANYGRQYKDAARFAERLTAVLREGLSRIQGGNVKKLDAGPPS